MAEGGHGVERIEHGGLLVRQGLKPEERDDPDGGLRAVQQRDRNCCARREQQTDNGIFRRFARSNTLSNRRRMN
jgi:hypothetical protein